MNKENILLAIAGTFFLTLVGCSALSSNVNTSVASSTDPAQIVSTFVVADLQAADKTALATGDTNGSKCFEYLIPKVQQLQAAEVAAQANTAGAISAAEVSHGMTVILNNAKTGLSSACAPWVADAVSTATQLAAKFNTAAALAAAVPTGGASLLTP